MKNFKDSQLEKKIELMDAISDFIRCTNEAEAILKENTDLIDEATIEAVYMAATITTTLFENLCVQYPEMVKEVSKNYAQIPTLHDLDKTEHDLRTDFLKHLPLGENLGLAGKGKIKSNPLRHYFIRTCKILFLLRSDEVFRDSGDDKAFDSFGLIGSYREKIFLLNIIEANIEGAFRNDEYSEKEAGNLVPLISSVWAFFAAKESDPNSQLGLVVESVKDSAIHRFRTRMTGKAHEKLHRLKEEDSPLGPESFEHRRDQIQDSISALHSARPESESEWNSMFRERLNNLFPTIKGGDKKANRKQSPSTHRQPPKVSFRCGCYGNTTTQSITSPRLSERCRSSGLYWDQSTHSSELDS